ncbi:MAG: hypothetical protein PUG21_01805, partial [Prevotella sp.]|nr:hypothetical protein [Prevotella sp.]
PEPGSNSPLYIMSLAPKINRAISSQETLQTDRVNCNPTPDSGQDRQIACPPGRLHIRHATGLSPRHDSLVLLFSVYVNLSKNSF